jgi:hypothetical protein
MHGNQEGQPPGENPVCFRNLTSIYDGKRPMGEHPKLYECVCPTVYILSGLVRWWETTTEIQPWLSETVGVLCWVAAIAATVGSVGQLLAIVAIPFTDRATLAEEYARGQYGGIYWWWTIPAAALALACPFDVRTALLLVAASLRWPLSKLFYDRARRILDS